MGVQFKDVAAAALAMAPLLLAEWLGGSRKGHEWLGERKANGGLGDSWCVNLNTGQWLHGAGDERGLDLISLYAALNHVDQLPALKAVADVVGITDRPTAPILPSVQAPESPCEQIPEDAPDLARHPQHGVPSEVYAYGDAFWVARYNLKEGKQFTQHTWRDGKWHRKGYPAPKPIYNLAGLAKDPTVQVLVVEGEKCAEAAIETLKAMVITTWAGGSSTVRKNDWSPLAGRDVLIWPDADEPGRKAAAELAQDLAKIASRVRVIQPDRDDKWDVADAIAGGMTAKEIYDWIRTHLKSDVVPKCEPEAPPPIETEYLPLAERKTDDDYPAATVPRSFLTQWQELKLDSDSKQVPHATLANASAIIQRHEYFRGKVWLDSFRGKVYHTLDGVARLWTDADDRRVTAWIQQQLQLPKMNLNLVRDATLHAAECNQRNSLTDWLDSLEWDGIERLDTWLNDCLGAERNEYNDAIARNWPISMVARAYRPGCQVDTMPVIEGTMGRGKSRFLEVLAEPWFAAIQIAFGEKDFFQAIQGRWLIEVPDMSGFSRREHTQILATITTRVDVYRKSHGRITEEHPRVTVFAATSETDDYLHDPRGRRRYWPLRCGDINLDALQLQRENIFSEAVVRYRAGEGWHQMPARADEEQLARSSGDLWTEAVLAAAEVQWDLQERTGIEAKITSSRLLEEINVKIDKQTDAEKKRIARIMASGGWFRSRTSKQRYWLKLPNREEK
jgi:predicted P-loop ATPase/5S rRNA maturation endonuclease (ribonuclease M5)